MICECHLNITGGAWDSSGKKAPGFVEYNIGSKDFTPTNSSLVGNSASQYYTTSADNMYFVGNVTTEIYVVDFKKDPVSINEWQSIPISEASKNLAYASACLASTKKYLFVIGGQDKDYERTNSARTLSTVHVFEFGNNWIPNKEKLNTARINAACIAHGNDVYVIGGEGDEAKNEKYGSLQTLSSIEKMSIKTWTWKPISNLKVPMRYTKAILFGDDIIVFGVSASGKLLNQTVHVIETKNFHFSNVSIA